jgi:anti-anti-sigma factor
MDITDDDDEHLNVSVTSDEDGTAVITVVGEIDIDTVDELRSAVSHAVEEGATGLVFDLSGVAFMDSSGIAVLLESRAMTTSMLLRKPSHVVQRVIEATGLHDALVIEP